MYWICHREGRCVIAGGEINTPDTVVIVDVGGLSLIRVVSNSVAPLFTANSAGSCRFPSAQSQYHEAASPFGGYLYTPSIRGCTKLWFHIAENMWWQWPLQITLRCKCTSGTVLSSKSIITFGNKSTLPTVQICTCIAHIYKTKKYTVHIWESSEYWDVPSNLLCPGIRFGSTSHSSPNNWMFLLWWQELSSLCWDLYCPHSASESTSHVEEHQGPLTLLRNIVLV